MTSTLFIAFSLALFAGIASSSKQDVYGICNQYREAVKFENKEESGNNCDAPSGGTCYSPGKRAFVPKCESGQDFNNHRFVIHVGNMDYSIWKKDSDNKIYGGVSADSSCRGNQLISYNQGDSWLVVIRPDASIYLTPLSQGCPKAPAPNNKWDKPKGMWKQIQSIAGGEISLSLSVGTSSTDSNARTNDWTTSLTTSISADLIFASASVSTTISHSISTQTSNSLTKSAETTQSFKCSPQANTQVTMYQWIITAGHGGKQTTVANTPNIICVYGFNAPAPKCPLGACNNLGCTSCKSWTKTGKLFDEMLFEHLVQ